LYQTANVLPTVAGRREETLVVAPQRVDIFDLAVGSESDASTYASSPTRTTSRQNGGF